MKSHLWSSYLFDKTDNNKREGHYKDTWNNKFGLYKAEVVAIMSRSVDHTHTLGGTRKVYLQEAFGRSGRQRPQLKCLNQGSAEAGSPDGQCRLFQRVLNPGWVANGGSHQQKQIRLTHLNRHPLTNTWISVEQLSATKPKVLLRGQNTHPEAVLVCTWRIGG